MRLVISTRKAMFAGYGGITRLTSAVDILARWPAAPPTKQIGPGIDLRRRTEPLASSESLSPGSRRTLSAAREPRRLAAAPNQAMPGGGSCGRALPPKLAGR